MQDAFFKDASQQLQTVFVEYITSVWISRIMEYHYSFAVGPLNFDKIQMKSWRQVGGRAQNC